MGPLTLMKRRLQGQSFLDQDIRDLDLSSILASGATFRRCRLTNVDMSLGDFRSTTWEDCTLSNCKLSMTNWSGSNLRQVRFENCELRHAAFLGVHPIDRVVFDRCNLHYSTFLDSTVRVVAFPGSNLHGADLRFIECESANFEGAVLWGAHQQFGCAFWNGTFDERSMRVFVAMIARRFPDETRQRILEEVAGVKAVALVERMMKPTEESDGC